jgi:uncharacterized protein with von Willebrand factor type A (vWA) domain
MTDNMYDRNVRGRKRGKLDMHHLWRAETGATNVFMQKSARRGKKYNIVLCIDESSSMSGPNINSAAEVAAFLTMHFNKLNLDVAVVGFNNDVRIHKELDKSFTDNDCYDLYTNIVSSCYGGTDDLAGMRKSYELLAGKVKEKNIVIMVSDGESGYNNEIHRLVHDNDRLAEAFGIGIGSQCGQIPRNVTISDISKLKPEIIGYLREVIRRGA